MIDTLYDKFKPWSAKGSVYIISDTHFEDEDCKLMDADYISTPQEIEEAIEKVLMDYLGVNADIHVSDIYEVIL